MKSLMNIINNYLNIERIKEDNYNQDLKQLIKCLFMMFKNQDYKNIVKFISTDSDYDKQSKIQQYSNYFQCPNCECQLTHNSIIAIDTSNTIDIDIKCMICNKNFTNIDNEYYQCEWEMNDIACKECCIALTLRKLLQESALSMDPDEESSSSSISMSLFVGILNDKFSIDNLEQIVIKMFNKDIVGKYYDPSMVMFRICENSRYIKLNMIEKFIILAPTYINKRIEWNVNNGVHSFKI